MTLPPSNATLGPNIGQLLQLILLFHPKEDIFSPENAIFSRKQSSFLTNGWHFPTNYATLSQKEHFSDKYLPFSLKNTARHSSTGHFLPSTPRFLPKGPLFTPKIPHLPSKRSQSFPQLSTFLPRTCHFLPEIPHFTWKLGLCFQKDGIFSQAYLFSSNYRTFSPKKTR